MTGSKANRVCFRQTCSLAMLTNALGAELVRRAKRWYFLVADYAFGTDARDRLVPIAAFENHRYDAAKAEPGVFRACDHQAVQETYCAEMLPRAKRRDPNEYVRIVSAIGGQFAAGPCTNPDSAKAAELIGGERIPAREGYAPVVVRG
jgi:hypothetical protein